MNVVNAEMAEKVGVGSIDRIVIKKKSSGSKSVITLLPTLLEFGGK